MMDVKKKRLLKRKYVEVQCAYCGKEKKIRSDSVKEKNYCDASCSQKDRLRSPENHPSWKGGRRINHQGYVEVLRRNHPRTRGNGYVFEHILVAERKLGRPLKLNEQVHHINKIKTDNRPENLLVLDIAEHARLHGKEKKRVGKYLNCVVCGKEFYRKPSHVKRAKCCSLKCVGYYTNMKKKGLID